MAEYIAKDALIKTTEETPFTMSMFLNRDQCEGANMARHTFAAIFKILPAADVVEVRHAYWRDIQPPDQDNNVQCWCSACGAGELHADGMIVPYCWKCGAKMDGERKGGDE